MPNLFQAANGIDSLERLALRDSPVHRLHSLTKLLVTMVYVVIVVSFPTDNVSGLLPFLFYPVSMMALSDTPWRPLLGRLLAALPFALAGGLSSLLLLRDPAFAVGGFVVSRGAVSLASILLKTLFTVAAVLLLIATTSFVEIAGGLRRLRVPDVFCLQLVMTYRYISVLLGEAVSMYTAYALRAPGCRGVRMRDMGSFLGQLLLRSFDRAERVFQAMKCRGFTGSFRSGKRSGPPLREALLLGVLCLVFFLMRLYNLSLFFAGLVS